MCIISVNGRNYQQQLKSLKQLYNTDQIGKPIVVFVTITFLPKVYEKPSQSNKHLVKTGHKPKCDKFQINCDKEHSHECRKVNWALCKTYYLFLYKRNLKTPKAN